MGQPPQWEPYLVPAVSWTGDGGGAPTDAWRGVLTAGVYRNVTHPLLGLFGLAGEAYATVHPGVQPGARLFATSRAFGLAAGVDWDGRDRSVNTILSFEAPIRRGGLLGHGTMLRLDWVPARHALSAGIRAPLAQPWAGRTRPRLVDVTPPEARPEPLPTDGAPAGAEAALAKVAESASMLLAYTNLYPDAKEKVNYGPSSTAVNRAYEQALVDAFRIAAGDPVVGDSIARRARTGLLDDVLIPFDSLLGRVKAEKSIRALTTHAQTRFVTWLRDSAGVGAAAQPAIAAVHARWLGVIEHVHADLLRQWYDSRIVWLPMQLALSPDEYDEQSEVDALIERAVGHPFTDRNAIAYLRSADIPLEIVRTVFATRDYHVLWTHDFSGEREGTNRLDEVSYAMVADGYLPALTAAVQRYDSTGTMPLYIIFQDQWYYDLRDGRVWMDILENPLGVDMKLPKGNADKEAHLRQRQRELRAAVSASVRLRHDAIAHGGGEDRFVHRVVKVHVNVMQPGDFSFRSNHIIPPLPFVPDNIMRDHRKVVIYDVSEADPYRGAALIMGVGIGENYASPTWEDRGYRVRGPAALEVRAAARRALKTNGFKESDIPPPLAVVTQAPKADSSTAEYVGRALQVHNEAGFGKKESSVARAMLYNLAPPGSVIIVPDPIWVSETWAAMLVSAAARGCRVFIISPARANAPIPDSPVTALQNDVMLRLLQSRDRMREQMRATGGELRIGLYNARADIDDVTGRAREVRQGLARAPWLRELFPFDSTTVTVLNRALDQAEATGGKVTLLSHGEATREPKLHQKTQLVARPGAIAALLRQPGWDDVVASSMRAQSRQTQKFSDQLGWVTPTIDSTALRNTDALLRGYEGALSEGERKSVSFYFSLGSQNMDPRGLMSDGEATLIVSGLHAAAGVVDLYYVMARTTWIDTKAQLDALVPRPKGILGRIAHLIRFTL